MLPDPRLIVAARHLVGLSREELASTAQLSASTLKRFELGLGNLREESVRKIVAVLEARGVEFIAGGRAVEGGVLLLKRSVADSGSQSSA